jgi:hypothetical protein
MEKTKKTASGFTYEPMPSTMYLDLKERQVREKIADQESGIIRYIGKIRSKGIAIKTEEDLRKFTPGYVRAQIADSKKKRLQDTQFLPLAIRKREESEFREMENELVPLADAIQGLLNQIPFKIHLGADDKDIYFNAEDVDKYITEQCTMQVPEDIRQYYNELQKVCEAWGNLRGWAKDHGFIEPNMKIAQTVIGEYRCVNLAPDLKDLERCIFNLSHKEMFNLYQYGIIKKS